MRASCGTEFLLLWCYDSLGIAAHNMLMGVMAVMGPPPHNSHITSYERELSRVHGVMAREATPNCSRGSASIANYFLFCPQVK